MREAELHLQVLALERGTVADAHELELLGEAVRGALDHVRDERAHEAVEGLRVAAVVRALDDDVVALALDDHDLGEAAGELALRALDRHGGAVDGNVDAGRNGDGLFADTRHIYLPPFPTTRTR